MEAGTIGAFKEFAFNFEARFARKLCKMAAQLKKSQSAQLQKAARMEKAFKSAGAAGAYCGFRLRIDR